MANMETVRQTDRKGMEQVKNLLRQEGIDLDGHLEETVGAFDDDGELIATGSIFGCTLRCMAVSGDHRGEGLMAEIVGELLSRLAMRGIMHVFVYTKPAAAVQFKQLGFTEIASVPGKLVFLENRRGAFDRYLTALSAEKKPLRTAAVVMNANPFTLGHRYLLETASRENDVVHCFVVSEDKSLVPYAVRMRLVQAGAADLKNIVFHPSGDYIISSATFPSYFLTSADDVVRVHASLDAKVFAKIAQALGVSARYVGDEPFSRTTKLYNGVLQETLPEAGVDVRIIARRGDESGRAISATSVRKCLQNGDIEGIRAIVPQTTYDFFASPEAEPVLARIRAAATVEHD